MFKVIGKLTNVKPPKNDIGVIVTTPTDGQLRISPKAAALLGFTPGDYVDMVFGENEDGSKAIALCRGKKGDDDNANVGAKLASANGKAGSSLNFSSSNAYNQMGGGKTIRKIFKVAETPVQSEQPEYAGVDFYPCNWLEDQEVVPRESRAEGEDEDEDFSVKEGATADTPANQD